MTTMKTMTDTFTVDGVKTARFTGSDTPTLNMTILNYQKFQSHMTETLNAYADFCKTVLQTVPQADTPEEG